MAAVTELVLSHFVLQTGNVLFQVYIRELATLFTLKSMI
jgi:hypothetical protein